MNDDTRRLLVGLGGVLAAVIVGSVVGTTVVEAYGLSAAYAQGISVGFIAPAVLLTSLARSDFDREGYFRDRGRDGIILEAVAVGIAGLVGGLVGARVAMALSLTGSLGALVPFLLGMLGASALFVGRNRTYYDQFD